MPTRSTFLVALIAVLVGPAAPGAQETDSSAEIGSHFTVEFEISLHSTVDGPDFRAPRGVSTDLFGNVFVADTENHRVLQFEPSGRLVFEFGGYGWNVGEMSRPTDVTAREGFQLFVVDQGNDRIQQFRILDLSAEGSVFPFQEGTGLGGEELVRPSFVEIDAEGRVYVSDSLCHCVWIFTPTGFLINRLGGLGDVDTRFRDPGGIAIGPRGKRIYIADSGNRRVQVFDSVGNWLSTWGGPEEDLFVEPTGIDVGPDGNVYVADAGASRVRVLEENGIPLFEFGTEGDGPGSFRAPVDVAVGPDGRIWVVDEVREVVEGYRIVRTADEG